MYSHLSFIDSRWFLRSPFFMISMRIWNYKNIISNRLEKNTVFPLILLFVYRSHIPKIIAPRKLIGEQAKGVRHSKV